MKRFFTLILAILAVMACPPKNLEPEEQDPTVTTKRRRI